MSSSQPYWKRAKESDSGGGGGASEDRGAKAIPTPYL